MTKELETYILTRFAKGELVGEVTSGDCRHRVIADRLVLYFAREDSWIHSNNDQLWQLACRAAIAHYWPVIEVIE